MFKSIDEIKKILLELTDESEAYKFCSTILGPCEAYCTYYKDTLRDQILDEQCNKEAKLLEEKGYKIVEKALERVARNSKEYKDAGLEYRKALELKVFLKTYLAGLKISHEKQVAEIYQETATIKQNIYHKGS